MSGLLGPVFIILGAALFGMVGIMVKHRLFPPEPDSEPSDGVGEYIATVVGVLYALVLGLALVAVWETRDNAESHVKAEASSLNQVYILAQAIPAPYGPTNQGDVKSYADLVVHKEWAETAAHKPLAEEGWASLGRINTAVESYIPVGAVQQNVSAESLSQLSTVYDARRSRDGDSEAGLSPILWTGLVFGGVLTVAFIFWFGVERRRTHLAMVMGLSALIGFMMLLIFDLSHPYSGGMGIKSDVFTRYFSPE